MFTLRAANADDRNAVEQLLTACSLPLDGLDEQFPDRYAVAGQGGEIAAVAGVEFHGAYGLLRSMAVESRHRGEGIANMLVEDRMAYAHAAGLRAVYLLTTTAADYFARRGFTSGAREAAPEEIRDCREFRSACPASAVLMMRPIAS